MRLNLTTKAIIVVVIPCVLQLALLAGYSSLFQRLEKILENESNAKTVSARINWIGFVFAYSLLILSTAKDGPEKVRSLADLEVMSKNSLSELAALLAGSKEQERVIPKLKDVSQRIFAPGTNANGDGTSLIREQFSNARHDILAIQKSKFRVQATDLPVLRKSVGYLIGGLALVSVGTGIFLIFLFQRNVVKRLHVIEENSERFSSGKELKPPVAGDDEIALLDRGFHQMAERVEESARKERAIIKNATAVICSLSTNGEFIQVNPACRKILGYDEVRLKTMILSDLLAAEYRADIGRILKEASDSSTAVEFENKIVKPDGQIVDILWSAQWSPAEQALFCIAQDVTEKNRIEELKKEIVSMVSHDLRSPIMAITSAIYLMRNGKDVQLTPTMEKHLTTAQVSADRMKTLVDDLLDIEKIKSGKLEIDQQNVDLAEVFDEVVLSLSPRAKTVDVSLEVEGEPPVAYIDHDRIVQVIVNLVANALKFSPAGSTIRLEGTLSEKGVSVFVQDEGPGIPPDLLPVLFERFTQAKAGGAAAKGGSGLGLAICKSLVELHGGSIWAEAPQTGGTRIVFTLPKAH